MLADMEGAIEAIEGTTACNCVEEVDSCWSQRGRSHETDLLISREFQTLNFCFNGPYRLLHEFTGDSQCNY